MSDFKIKVVHSSFYFISQWFALHLKTICRLNIIAVDDESV